MRVICFTLISFKQSRLIIMARNSSYVFIFIALYLQKLPVLISAGNSSKNAISLVNEYAQANSLKIEFNCNSFGPDHRKRSVESFSAKLLKMHA